MTPSESIPAFLGTELAPSRERAAAVMRMTTACVVTMLAVLVFRIPNGFLAVFYALAVSRENPSKVLHHGFAIVLGNLAGTVLALAGIVFFIDHPLPHFLFLGCAFFLSFFFIRTLTSYSAAFGFGVILVAASSVNIIWARPNPLRPDVSTVLWTSFGMIAGTLATIGADWLFSPHVQDEASDAPGGMFVADAFSNPAHLVFALKGCLAAMICYVTWSALAWPGLGVCTVTCVIAAPMAAHGSARHRLTTRILGLLTGGVLCGMGSQIFLLPMADSIVGFAIPFAAVSAFAAWVATSGPRLAYFGRQMALAYYLTIFQGWGPSATLTISRDRLMGILLGLVATWLVFDARFADQLNGHPE